MNISSYTMQSTAEEASKKPSASATVEVATDIAVQSNCATAGSIKRQLKGKFPDVMQNVAVGLLGLPPSSGTYQPSDSVADDRSGLRLSTYNNDYLRRGKWTIEEETFAEKLVAAFKEGSLPLPKGTTLRSLLSVKLNCSPMRITKKFQGLECIGRRAYPGPSDSVNDQSIARIMEELGLLEAAFLRRLRQENGGSRDFTPTIPAECDGLGSLAAVDAKECHHQICRDPYDHSSVPLLDLSQFPLVKKKRKQTASKIVVKRVGNKTKTADDPDLSVDIDSDTFNGLKLETIQADSHGTSIAVKEHGVSFPIARIRELTGIELCAKEAVKGRQKKRRLTNVKSDGVTISPPYFLQPLHDAKKSTSSTMLSFSSGVGSPFPTTLDNASTEYKETRSNNIQLCSSRIGFTGASDRLTSTADHGLPSSSSSAVLFEHSPRGVEEMASSAISEVGSIRTRPFSSAGNEALAGCIRQKYDNWEAAGSEISTRPLPTSSPERDTLSRKGSSHFTLSKKKSTSCSPKKSRSDVVQKERTLAASVVNRITDREQVEAGKIFLDFVQAVHEQQDGAHK